MHFCHHEAHLLVLASLYAGAVWAWLKMKVRR